MNRQCTEFSGITLKTAENGKLSVVSLQCEKLPKHKGDFYSHKVFILTNFYHLPDGDLMLLADQEVYYFKSSSALGKEDDDNR